MFSLLSTLMNIFLGLGIFFSCPGLVWQGQERDSHIWEGRRFYPVGEILVARASEHPCLSLSQAWRFVIWTSLSLHIWLSVLSLLLFPFFCPCCFQEITLIFAFCVSNWRGNRGRSNLGNARPKLWHSWKHRSKSFRFNAF